MSKSLHKKLIEESKSKLSSFLNDYSQSIINDEASVFIGSGVSRISGLPSWNKLLDPCIEELGLNSSTEISLYKIAQYYAGFYCNLIHFQLDYHN